MTMEEFGLSFLAARSPLAKGLGLVQTRVRERITRHRAHVRCAHDSDALIAQVHLLNAISRNSHFDMNSEEQVQVRPMSARDRGDYLPFSRRQVHDHRRVRPTRSCKPGTEHAQFVPRD